MAARRRGELTVRVLADTSRARKDLRELGDESSRVGKIARIGFASAATGVAALVFAIGSSIGPAAELQSAIAEVATLSEAAAERSVEYTEGVKRLSVETGQAQQDLTQALYDTVSAGVDASEAIGFVETASKLATAGVTDVAVATDALTTATNAWSAANLTAGEASDAIFATVQAGKTTVEEFGGQLFQVAPLAANLGVSIQEVGASVATLTSQGAPTAQAMTQVRGAIAGMLRPTAELTAAFNAAGFSSGQAAIEAVGFGGAAEILRDASGGSIGELQKMVGTIEGVQAILGVTGQQAELFAGNLESIDSASGEAERAYNRMANTFEFQRRRLNQGIQLLRVEVGTLFLPVLTELAGYVNDNFIPVLLNWREEFAPLIDLAGEAGEKFGAVKSGVEELAQAAGSAPIDDLRADLANIVSALTSGDIDFLTAAKAVRGALADALAEILGGEEGFEGAKDRLKDRLMDMTDSARADLESANLPAWATDLVTDIDNAIDAYLSGGVSLTTAQTAIQNALQDALGEALGLVITDLETNEAPVWVSDIATTLDAAIQGNISLPSAGTEITDALTVAVTGALDQVTDNEEVKSGVTGFLEEYGDLIARTAPFVLLPILGPIGIAIAGGIGATLLAYNASEDVRNFVDPLVTSVREKVDEHLPGLKEKGGELWAALTEGIDDFQTAVTDEFEPSTLDVSKNLNRMGEDAEQFATRVKNAMTTGPDSVAVSSAEMAAAVGDDSILVGYWLGAYLAPVWESHQTNANASYESTLLFSQSLVDLAKEIGLNQETFDYLTEWASNWAHINALGARDATVLLQDSMGALGRHILDEFRSRIDTATGALRALKRAADDARTALRQLNIERAKEVPVLGGVISGVSAIADAASQGLPTLPTFQHGGIVPGPPGQPVPIIAHGGEEFLGVGDSRRPTVVNNITNNYISGSLIAERDVDRRVNDARRRDRPNQRSTKHI